MARRKISFEGLARLPFEEWEDETESQPVRRNVYARAEIKRERPVPELISERIIHYVSFGSGSSGNSCYIGTPKGGVIIDAGIKSEDIENGLKSNGIDIKKVWAVLLTHDHADHVKYVYSLVKNNRHIRVFCTNKVLNGIMRRHGMSKRLKDYHVAIFKEIPFTIGDFSITAFEVPHDGSDNMGFSLNFDNRNFVLATDMGEVSHRAAHYIGEADYLVIESNYDRRMLIEGRYPAYLKARIQTSHGHMDNLQTATFLKENITPRLKYIFLCHLSKDNNTPQLALKAVRTALEEAGKKVGKALDSLEDRDADVQLMALPRFDSTRLFVFRPNLGEQG